MQLNDSPKVASLIAAIIHIQSVYGFEVIVGAR